MAAGNMGTIVEVENNDEVGKLAESFNSMSVQLEARQNELYKSMEMLKNSREEIIKEQNFKNTVFENIETGVITIDIDNTITFINSPAKNILKIPDRKTGQNLLKAMSGWENLQQEFNKILKFDPEQKWSQYIEEEKAGRLITFRVTILPLHVGSSDGRIITIEDLTERVNMRSQMNRMERLASMGRLSAGLAHEIRNPLTGINIMLDDLHDRLLGNQNDQVLIQKSLQEIERIEGLVNELLSFARTTSAQMEKGNIGNILKDILLLMSKQCQKRGIEIEKHIAIDLIEFPIDSLKIKQAFLNLINNAIEAMPEGGRLIVKAYNEANKVKVIIKDTGEGISKEQIQYLFEPFYTTKGEGTGLGLAITHNIVSDHNAKIDVQSNIGEGTEFIVTFPSST
jgi:signal transduction histidine kinase